MRKAPKNLSKPKPPMAVVKERAAVEVQPPSPEPVVPVAALIVVEPPPPPPPTWSELIGSHVDGLEAEVSTHENRKAFYAKDGDGVTRVQSTIGELTAFIERLNKLNRAV